MNLTERHLQWTLAVLATAIWITLVYKGGSEYGFGPILIGLIIGIPIIAVKLYMMDPLGIHDRD